MSNVVSLWRHRRMRISADRRAAPPAPTSTPGIKAVFYQPGAIHEGVCISRLVQALTAAGFTFSTVDGLGLVIHRTDHNPTLPAPPDLAS